MAKKHHKEVFQILDLLSSDEDEVSKEIKKAEDLLVLNKDTVVEFNKKRLATMEKAKMFMVKPRLPVLPPLEERNKRKINPADKEKLPKYYLMRDSFNYPSRVPPPPPISKEMGKLIEQKLKFLLMTNEERAKHKSQTEINESKANEQTLKSDKVKDILHEEVKKTKAIIGAVVANLKKEPKANEKDPTFDDSLFATTSLVGTQSDLNEADKQRVKMRIKKYNDSVVLKKQKQCFLIWKKQAQDPSKPHVAPVAPPVEKPLIPETESKITKDKITVKELSNYSTPSKAPDMESRHPGKLMKFIPDCNNIYSIKRKK